MSKRVCSVPGCPALTDTGRCTKHRREADRARGTRQARGYDRDYDRTRARWQRRLDAGETIVCWRPDCDTVIDPTDWHLGHDDHDRSIIRGPECPPHNLSHAGQAAHH